MDPEMELRHLEQAERHIAQGERHIEEQEQRIASLASVRADTSEAQRLLNNLFATQMLHIAHRERLLRELEGKRLGPSRPHPLRAASDPSPT
jgi:hypothetical protein